GASAGGVRGAWSPAASSALARLLEFGAYVRFRGKADLAIQGRQTLDEATGQRDTGCAKLGGHYDAYRRDSSLCFCAGIDGCSNARGRTRSESACLQVARSDQLGTGYPGRQSTSGTVRRLRSRACTASW